MSEEILINVTPQETRVAVIENGVLVEAYIERVRHRGIVGNIYKGRVARILPGMQAAFVEIGLDRAAFLHAADVRPAPENGSRLSGFETVGSAAVARAPHSGAWVTPRIQELLHEGQEVVVQVLKDALGSKGARITTQITLPGRYIVFMPYNRHIAVSQKIG
ncbi:MAG: Rne/Rng family ribonuclease, partial [Sulfurifustaceae bacterium]